MSGKQIEMTDMRLRELLVWADLVKDEIREKIKENKILIREYYLKNKLEIPEEYKDEKDK